MTLPVTSAAAPGPLDSTSARVPPSTINYWEDVHIAEAWAGSLYNSGTTLAQASAIIPEYDPYPEGTPPPAGLASAEARLETGAWFLRSDVVYTGLVPDASESGASAYADSQIFLQVLQDGPIDLEIWLHGRIQTDPRQAHFTWGSPSTAQASFSLSCALYSDEKGYLDYFSKSKSVSSDLDTILENGNGYYAFDRGAWLFRYEGQRQNFTAGDSIAIYFDANCNVDAGSGWGMDSRFEAGEMIFAITKAVNLSGPFGLYEMSGAPRLIGLEPKGGRITAPVDQLRIRFNQPVIAVAEDFELLDALDVNLLTGAGFTMEAGQTEAVFTFVQPFPTGIYKFRAFDSIVDAATGTMPLDGDDDLQPGGDYRHSFEAALPVDYPFSDTVVSFDWGDFFGRLFQSIAGLPGAEWMPIADQRNGGYFQYSPKGTSQASWPPDSELDDYSWGVTVELPFPVSFENRVYQTALMWPQGVLSFAAGGVDWIDVIPNDNFADTLYPYWGNWVYDTMDPLSGGWILTEGMPPDRICTIEWTGFQVPNEGTFDPEYRGSFQVRFYENTGSLEYCYGELVLAADQPRYSYGQEVPIGLEEDGSNSALVVTDYYGSARIWNNTVLRFDRPEPFPQIASLHSGAGSFSPPTDRFEIYFTRDVLVSMTDVEFNHSEIGYVMPDFMEYDPVSFKATFVFSQPLPLGTFYITVYDSVVDFVNSFPLDGDEDGIPGGEYSDYIVFNTPPEFSESTYYYTALTGRDFHFHLSASDPDEGQTVYYNSWSDLPYGSFFDYWTGFFSWTPMEWQTGVYEISFYAYDDGPGGASSQPVRVLIQVVSDPSSTNLFAHYPLDVDGSDTVMPLVASVRTKPEGLFDSVLNGYYDFVPGPVDMAMQVYGLDDPGWGQVDFHPDLTNGFGWLGFVKIDAAGGHAGNLEVVDFDALQTLFLLNTREDGLHLYAQLNEQGNLRIVAERIVLNQTLDWLEASLPSGYGYGDWVHVAFVAHDNFWQIWLHGRLEASGYMSTDFSFWDESGYTFGAQNDGAYALHGGLDDLHLFDGPVSPDTIRALSMSPGRYFTINTIHPDTGWIYQWPEYSEFLEGSEVTFEATPDYGYRFTGWTDDLAGAPNPVTLAVYANLTVGAMFEANQAPVIVTGDQIFNIGDPVTFTVEAYDPDMPPDPLLFNLVGNVQPGMSIEPQTGLFHWDLLGAEPGYYTVSVEVTEDIPGGLSTTASIGITLISSGQSLIRPVSYSMFNGQTGSYRYLDDTYNGIGDPTLDGEPLSGGLGDLTDQVLGSSYYWSDLGNGPAAEWVGWSDIQPEIIFDFGRVATLYAVKIHTNTALSGGVSLWESVTFSFSDDGVNFTESTYSTVTNDAEKSDPNARFMVAFFGPTTTRFVKASFADGWYPWIFLSEFRFYQLGGTLPLEPQFTDFSSVEGLNFLGRTRPNGSELRLLASEPYTYGNVWYYRPLPVADGFQSNFRFRLSDLRSGGGEGFAFVVQPQEDDLWCDHTGPGGSALVLSFDTYHNGGNQASLLGPDRQVLASVDLTQSGINLKDQSVHQAEVYYDGWGISVRLDGMWIFQGLSLGGLTISGATSGADGMAWAGFAGYCGGATQEVNLLDWTFTSGPAVPDGVVANPRINPSHPYFNGGGLVTLSTPTPGATIHYTLDGSEPTESSTVYEGPIAIQQSARLQARAFLVDAWPSGISAAMAIVGDGRRGNLLRETWSGTSFANLADFQSLSVYPMQPSHRQLEEIFNLPPYSGDGNNVTRLVGYVHPPETGNYTFYLSASVEGQLYLSSDDDPNNRTLVAECPGPSSYGYYYNYARQISDPVALEAGRRYYIEALARQPFNSDHLNIGWMRPSGAVIESPIAITHFSPWGQSDLPGQPPAPELSPNGTVFPETLTVALSCPMPGVEIRYTTDGSEPSAQSPLYSAPLVLTETTFLQARAFLAGRPDGQITRARYVWEPASAFPRDHLQYWLRADQGVESVPETGASAMGPLAYRWNNLSGNFPNGMTNDDDKRWPVLAASMSGGQAALRFDGLDDGLLAGASFEVGRPSTVFIVYERLSGALGRTLQSGSGYNYLLGLHGSPGYYAEGWVRSNAPAEIGVPYVAMALQKTDGSHFYLNGRNLTDDPRPVGTLGRPAVGGGAGTYFEPVNADIAELLCFDKALDPTERQAVEAYLNARYGLFVPLAATPVILPPSGPYAEPVPVSIVCSTPGSSIYYTLDGSDPTEGSLPYQGPFEMTASGAVRARAFAPGYDPSPVVGAYYQIGAVSPSFPDTGLILWLRADAGLTFEQSGQVSVWQDISGHGHRAEQNLSFERSPSWTDQSINGHPAVVFDGSNDGLTIDAGLHIGKPATIFYVYKPTATQGYGLVSTTNNWYLGSASGTNTFVSDGQVGGAPLMVGDPYLAVSWQSDAEAAFYLNGRDHTRSPGFNSASPGHLCLGGGSIGWPAGVEICEILAFDEALSETARQAVESYLGDKYGFFLPVASPPVLTPGTGRYASPVTVTMTTSTVGAEIRYTLDGSEPDLNSPLYLDPIPLATITTVKAKTFHDGYEPSPTIEELYEIGASAAPISTVGLQLWLRADTAVSRDSQNHVSQWADLSGNSFGATMRNFAQQPVWVPDAVGGQPAILFDGLDDGMLVNKSLQVKRPSTIFLAYQAIDMNGGRSIQSTSRNWLFGLYYNTQGFYCDGWVRYNIPSVPGQPSVATAMQFPNASYYYLNGDNRTVDSNPVGDLLGVALGGGVGTYNEPSHSYISELLIYDRTMSDGERQQIESYLAGKYTAFTPTAATPLVNPGSGYSTAPSVEISMSCTTVDAVIYYTLDGSIPNQTSQLYSQPILLTGPTELKVRAFAPGYAPSAIVARYYGLQQTPPVPADGLAFWLRSDTGLTMQEDGSVEFWSDLSGHGADAFQNESELRPSLVADRFQGHPAVRFPTSNEGMRFLPPAALNGPKTIFLVHQAFDYPSGGVLFSSENSYWFAGPYSNIQGFYAGGWVSPYGMVVQPDLPTLTTAWQNGRISNYYHNGAFATEDRSLNNDLGLPTLNRSLIWGGVNNSELAEVIAYHRALDPAERRVVENYLADRYGLTLAAERPVLTPFGGAFNEPVLVTLSSFEPGAEIRYTSDGSEPNTGSPLYQGPFELTASAMVRAKAYVPGLDPSPSTAASFVISDGAPGSILREFYTNVTTPTIEGLFNSPNYPDYPAFRDYQTSLSTPANQGDYYGERLRGYLYPPETGDYTFTLASDDESQVFLSTDDDPAKMRQIASSISPVSEPIPLQAGHRYYVEVLHVEYYWDDFCVVQWQLPSGGVENPIPGSRLSPYGESDLPSVLPTPLISPRGGTFSSPLLVDITSLRQGVEIRYTTDDSLPTIDSTLYETPLLIAADTVLKARAFLDGFEDSPVAEAHFFIDPTITFNRSELAFWFRADGHFSLNGASASTWFDQSGAGVHASQPNSANQPEPVPGVLNGYPVVRFDGADDYFKLPPGFDGFPEGLTAFAVYSPAGANNWETFLDLSNGPNNNNLYWSRYGVTDTLTYAVHSGSSEIGQVAAADALPAGQFAIHSLTHDAQGFATLARNGLPLARANFSLPSNAVRTRNYLGRLSWDGYPPLHGDLAEILFFNRALTDLEQAGVEQYLASKYNLTLDLPAPQITPEGGIMTGPVEVSMSHPFAAAEIRYTTDLSPPVETSPLYAGPLVIDSPTVLRARAFAAGANPSPTVTARFTFDAETVFTRQNLLLWYRGDAGVSVEEGAVASWDSQAGQKAPASQDYYGSQPAWLSPWFNGQSALSFDGVDDSLNLPGAFYDFTSGLTIFVAVEPGAVGANQRFVEWGRVGGSDIITLGRAGLSNGLLFEVFDGPTGGGAITAPQALASGTPSIFTARLETTGLATLYKNGATLTSALSNAKPAALFRDSNFIARSNQFASLFQGAVAEILLFNRALPPLEREQVEAYLRQRYAISAQTVATPQFSPAPGFFTDPVAVTISTATPDAQIRYTLNGAEPTSLSTLYTGPISLTESALLKARGFLQGYNESATAEGLYSIGALPGSGDGLAAVYYDHPDFSGTSLRRLDPVVSFDWYDGSPDPILGGEEFSAVWTGELEPRFSEDYTLSVWSDDGIRLFLDGQLLLDDWYERAVAESSITLPLTRGQRYSIRLEYFEQFGGATVELGWSSLSTPPQVIPRSQLYSGLPFGPTVRTPQASPYGGTFGNSLPVTLACATPLAQIHYTLDGSEPDENSALYTAPILITDSASLRASAFRSGYNPSGTLWADYFIDRAGPTLGNWQFEGGEFLDGLAVGAPGTIRVDASDPAGVARVDFFYRAPGSPDDILFGSDTYGWDGYSAWFNADATPLDGLYDITIKAYDSLNTLTAETRQLNLVLTVPPTPYIYHPWQGMIVTQAGLTVNGYASRAGQVAVYVNNIEQPPAVSVDANGYWSRTIFLDNGDNLVQAAARNRAGEGLRDSRLVTLDRSVPPAPEGLTVSIRAGGNLQLSWFPSAGNITGYYLYRSDGPFETTAQAELVAPYPIGYPFEDRPPYDGTWYYRVSAVNTASTEGPLSNLASATSDGAAPAVAALFFTPMGQYDPATERFGQGPVEVEMQLTEPVIATPFLALTPAGGMPISVALQRVSDLLYRGTLVVGANTPSGPAYATTALRDAAGNRGSEIYSGREIFIDTDGPRILNLLAQPGVPIQNDPDTPVTVVFTAAFDSPVKPGTTPAFSYRLTNSAPAPIAIADVLAGGDALTWIVTLPLPATAGQTVESIELFFTALDDLDNTGSTILGSRLFEVYQGELPGLAAPQGLTAQARPAGQIELNWNPVASAADYQILRKLPADQNFTPIEVSNGAISFFDLPPADGAWQYAVATIRRENNQQNTGPLSNIAAAFSDRVPPPAPFDLALQLVPQGLYGVWSRPLNLTEPVFYRFYRAGAGGQNPMPAAADFDELYNLDPFPDPDFPNYFVTAIDAAANESAPSATVYFNLDLLPVRTLSVTRINQELPVVSWTQVSGNIAGYNLFEGPDGAGRQLNNQGLIDGTEFIDTGFSGQSDRRYTVVAVDTNDQSSLGRSLRLPLLEASLPTDARLERNVMNRVDFRVDSQSPEAVGNFRLVATVNGLDHYSAWTTLAAGATRTVPVVIGGYPTLFGDNTPLRTTIEVAPNPGELASIVRDQTIALADGQIRLTLQPGAFLRGGNGQAAFSIVNTSGAEMEIVTAVGGYPSPEVRYVLQDESGAVISSAPLSLATGLSIFTLPNGYSVLRLAPGAEYTSPMTAVPVPSNAPDRLYLRFETDFFYHHLGQEDEVILNGLTTRTIVNLADTSYYGQVLSVSPAESNGDQPVRIEGKAYLREGDLPAPFARLLLKVQKSGFERTAELVTDASGHFAYDFQPLPSEGGGIYSVWAIHPDLTDSTPQKTFLIRRVFVSPLEGYLRAPRQYAQSIAVNAWSDAGVAVTQLRLEYRPEDQFGGSYPLGLTVDLAPAIPLVAPGQTVSLGASISGDDTAPQAGSIYLRVVSDETPGAYWALVTIHYELTGTAGPGGLSGAVPTLRFTPNFLDTGLNPGGRLTEHMTFENVGLVALERLRLALLSGDGSPAPAWARLSTDALLGDLEVGDKKIVPVVFQPPVGTPEGDYYLIVRAESDNHPTRDVNIHVALTAAGEGHVLFKVLDMFTGTVGEGGQIIEGVQGARIDLQNDAVASIVFNAVTDSYGEAILTDLPAGSYKYRVNADNHESSIGRVWVRPGTTVSAEVALAYNMVTIEWEVVPISIEDRYNIVLRATFETNVPAPVLVVDPYAINLPKMCAGDVFNGEFTLTNYGLIRAENLRLPLPASDAQFKVEFLSDVPDSIPAGQQIRVTYRLTALQEFGGDCPAGGGGSFALAESPLQGGDRPDNSPAFETRGGESNPCRYYNYSTEFPILWSYRCPNGLSFDASSRHAVGASFSTGECIGGGGGGGPIGGWGGWGGGGGGGSYGGGSGGGGVFVPLITGPDCSPREPRCGDGGKGGLGDILGVGGSFGQLLNFVGCSVNSMTRDFEEDSNELEVKLPGYYASFARVERRYRQGEWHFDGLGEKLQIRYAGDRLASLTLHGFEFLPVDVPRTIFQNGNNRIFREAGASDGFRFQSKSGHWREYDPDGHLLRYGTGPAGPDAFLEVVYNGNGRESELRDQFGQTVFSFEWSGDLLSAVQDAAGRRVEYTWTGGRLTQVKDVLGQVTTYEYTPNGQLARLDDPTGATHFLTYNPQGHLRSFLDENGQGRYFEFNYNQTSREYYTLVRSTTGQVEEKWFTGDGTLKELRLNGETVAKIVRGNRSLLLTDARGRTTRQEFDEWGNLTRYVTPDGYQRTYAYDLSLQRMIRAVDELGVVTTYNYDSAGRLTEVVQAAGTPAERKRTIEYDASGNPFRIAQHGDARTVEAVTEHTYDSHGFLQSTTDPAGLTETIEDRNAFGLPTARRDRNGHLWHYDYDLAGRPVELTNPLAETTLQFFDAFNNRTALRTPLQKTATATFDGSNRLTQTANPLGQARTFEYDADGNLLRQRDESGALLTAEYDLFNRVTKRIDAAGVEVRYFYDNPDPGARPARIEYPSRTEFFTYNDRWQPVIIETQLPGSDPFTETRSYSARGELLSMTDWEERTTTYDYDQLGRLVEVARPGQPAIQYTYDDRDNVIEMIGGRGGVWSFGYDLNNRMISATSPDGRASSLGYDGEDNLLWTIDGDGAKVEFSYDPAGRLSGVAQFQPGAETPEYTLAISRDADGRISGYTDGMIAATYAFDDAGRKTSETVHYGTFQLSHSYTYRPNGQRASFTAPTGQVYEYTYDVGNRLTGVVIPNVGILSINAYRENLPATITLPGGATIDRAYDDLLRLTEIFSVQSDQDGSAVIDQASFHYTPLGSLFKRMRTGGAHELFGYDEARRLASTPNAAYTYDGGGNRLTDSAQGPGSWSIDPDDRLLQDGRGYNYVWNDRGALISRDGPVSADYFYDAAGRLSRVETPGQVILYHYDPLGRRYCKEVNGVKTWYHWCDEGLAAIVDEAGLILQTFGWAPGSRHSSAPLFLAEGFSCYFFHTGHLGEPVLLTDSTGNIVWQADYDAFGRATVHTAQVDNPLRYPGQFFDAETGLHYNLHRYYDPDLGRYLQADPILFGTNFYAYAASNPLTYTDPDGLRQKIEVAIPSFPLCKVFFSLDMCECGVECGTPSWGPCAAKAGYNLCKSVDQGSLTAGAYAGAGCEVGRFKFGLEASAEGLQWEAGAKGSGPLGSELEAGYGSEGPRLGSSFGGSSSGGSGVAH